MLPLRKQKSTHNLSVKFSTSAYESTTIQKKIFKFNLKKKRSLKTAPENFQKRKINRKKNPKMAPLHPGFQLGDITGDRGRRVEVGIFLVLASSWSRGLGLASPSAEGLALVSVHFPLCCSHWFCNYSPLHSSLRAFECCWPGYGISPFRFL